MVDNERKVHMHFYVEKMKMMVCLPINTRTFVHSGIFFLMQKLYKFDVGLSAQNL